MKGPPNQFRSRMGELLSRGNVHHAYDHGSRLSEARLSGSRCRRCRKMVLGKRLRRSEVTRFFAALSPCLVGIEACGARELRRFGHDVRLMPPQYVRPYVKTNKPDAADADAICEAVQRPTMRFVPIKEADQQAALMLHRNRELLVRQRTMLANAVRAMPPSSASLFRKVFSASRNCGC
jgi:transposase